jgi:dienelactone hydrolase
MPAPTSTLGGWTAAAFTDGERIHDVYSKGSGPGVVLIPEVPGISPEVLGLADHLVENGFTVAIPSLFGVPGKPFSVGYAAGTIARLCVASEMKAFAAGAERPISRYLRALAAHLNNRTPGPGVGVIGLCFTGGFALAAAVDDAVLAAVMSEPSVPFPIGGKRKRDLGLSSAETSTVQRRTREGLCLLGLKFSQDIAVPDERFEGYRRAFGDAVELIVLDSSKGNADGYKRSAHSVLTLEVCEDPPNSASGARDRVVRFLTEHLPGSA